jgi:hypothetical protein
MPQNCREIVKKLGAFLREDERSSACVSIAILNDFPACFADFAFTLSLIAQDASLSLVCDARAL